MEVKEKKFIPLPIRIVENDFISEMFLLARIISENFQFFEIEVRCYQIFMLSKNEKIANINIILENGNNAVVTVSKDPGIIFWVYFSCNKKAKSCSYEDFQKKGFLELVNMIKD